MLQLASATAPDVDRNLRVAARLIWGSVLGHHAQAEAQSCWCGASSLRKAFGPRLHGCGAVGNMLQTALQRLQVLSPAPSPTKHFWQQPRLHAQTGILHMFASGGKGPV